jgi:hypothetical protein
MNSEKARSEFIIAPVMLELKKLTNYALFSGIEFNVDESAGVTTGTVWRFLRLLSKNLQIDLEEYSIREIEKILGLLRI